MSPRALTSLLPALALVGAACLVDPQVDDRPARTPLVLPAGAVVPSLYDDPALTARIAAATPFGPVVPLLAAFAAGAPVGYWDLGTAPDFASPAFVLYRRDGDELVELPHPPIFGDLPGERGYSPYRLRYVVEVTAAYAGEVIPSVAALNEAQERGLVGRAMLTPINLDWPVVTPDIVLDVGVSGGDGAGADAGAAAPTPRSFYEQGRSGLFFDLGQSALAADRVHVPTTDVYVLRREGGEPLSEPARGLDIDGDGDALDTNDVFAFAAGAPGYSPRCRAVSVTVGAAIASIDSSRRQDEAEIRAASQLVVDGVPVVPPVVAVRPEGRLFHCAQRRTGGAP